MTGDTATTYLVGFDDQDLDDAYNGVLFTLAEAVEIAEYENVRVALHRHEEGEPLEAQPAVGWADPDGNWRLL